MNNLYGDGIAHLNIARKVVDSRDPSLWSAYVQLGSPWLPVPHIVMLPFVWNDTLWRTGWAGTSPSLVSFVLAVWLVYRVGFELFDRDETAALLAAGILLLNPSVLFMASTPMTELPFIATLMAATFLMQRWQRAGDQSRRLLVAAALAVALTTLTRYEGWALVPAVAVVVAICSRGEPRHRAAAALLFLGVASTGPLFWLWHNWAIYGDALEFVRGPYSARTIFASQASRLGWASFVVGNPITAMGWALLAVAVVAGPVVLACAVIGLTLLVLRRKWRIADELPALLPLVPFGFLVVSLFRGEAQIYPIAAVALLNVRYAVPYLTAVALLVPGIRLVVRSRRAATVATVAIAAIVACQYAVLVSDGPSQLAVFQEAYRNSRNAKPWRDRHTVAAWLRDNVTARLAPSHLVLMDSGGLGPVVPESGLRFRQIVHEGTREWNEWSSTGALPSGVVLVVTREGDAAWGLRDDARFVSGFARVYRLDGPPAIEVWVANDYVRDILVSCNADDSRSSVSTAGDGYALMPTSTLIATLEIADDTRSAARIAPCLPVAGRMHANDVSLNRHSTSTDRNVVFSADTASLIVSLETGWPSKSTITSDTGCSVRSAN